MYGPPRTHQRSLRRFTLLNLNPYNKGVYGLPWIQQGHKYWYIPRYFSVLKVLRFWMNDHICSTLGYLWILSNLAHWVSFDFCLKKFEPWESYFKSAEGTLGAGASHGGARKRAVVASKIRNEKRIQSNRQKGEVVSRREDKQQRSLVKWLFAIQASKNNKLNFVVL